jgi:hypothetical protein
MCLPRFDWPTTLSLASLVLACTPAFPEVTWTGEHLHVAQEAVGLVCEGSNPYQDRFVERLAEVLGVEIDEPIRFAYIERSELEEYCFQDDIWGCYYDDKAYSIFPVLTHELAHAVADRAGWDGPRVFREGFAEAFAFNNDSGVERLPIRAVVEDFAVDSDNYYTAGLFVRFLVEAYGVERFGAFMRATRRDADFGAIAASFEAHLGETLDEALDAFDAYPTCSAWENQAAIVECGMEALPWGPDGLEGTVSLDCEDAGSIGPFSVDPPEMWAARSLDVPEDGTYTISVASTSPVASGVRLTHCGDCREAVDEIFVAGASRSVELLAGRYFATFVADSGQPAVVTFRLSAP